MRFGRTANATAARTELSKSALYSTEPPRSDLVLAPLGTWLEECQGGDPEGEGRSDAPREHGGPQVNGTSHAPGARDHRPAAMHTHAMRRARSAAAREADHDEMRYDLRGAGHAGCDGRDDGRG